MNRRWWTLVALAPLLVARPATAAVPEALVADVPFKFVAAGGAHDPGKYELRVASDQKTIELVAVANRKAEFEMVLTRLAGPEVPSEDRVVFDKVGDAYHLAEMWITGHDGFLLYSTKQPHAHHEVLLHSKGK